MVADATTVIFRNRFGISFLKIAQKAHSSRKDYRSQEKPADRGANSLGDNEAIYLSIII